MPFNRRLFIILAFLFLFTACFPAVSSAHHSHHSLTAPATYAYDSCPYESTPTITAPSPYRKTCIRENFFQDQKSTRAAQQLRADQHWAELIISGEIASGFTVATKSRTGGLAPHPSDPIIPGGIENYRGRYQAGLSAEGKNRLPNDWDVHHTTPQRTSQTTNPHYYLSEGRDIHNPLETRGVRGSRQPGSLEVTDPSGRIRNTNIHAEMDREISEFLETNPSREELDEFTRYMDWRWGHSFWENK